MVQAKEALGVSARQPVVLLHGGDKGIGSNQSVCQVAMLHATTIHEEWIQSMGQCHRSKKLGSQNETAL